MITSAAELRALLQKYMAYVLAVEGCDFVEGGYRGYPGDPVFTPAEWAQLERLSDRNHEDEL